MAQRELGSTDDSRYNTDATVGASVNTTLMSATTRDYDQNDSDKLAPQRGIMIKMTVISLCHSSNFSVCSFFDTFMLDLFSAATCSADFVLGVRLCFWVGHSGFYSFGSLLPLLLLLQFKERVKPSKVAKDIHTNRVASVLNILDDELIKNVGDYILRKAATLVTENENLKREKELAFKEYESLETTNKNLKTQIAKSINTEVEKTPVEPVSSVAEITPSSGNGPWFLYNHFSVPQIFWPSILQSSNPVHLQNTSFNSIAIPPNANVPCSSESESHHKQNNLINDN
ncbi:hypothetical protein JHK87_016414 [Glycine soja]|nr:hypothetical protein JHK87_016414 [Glycine soja]